MWLKEKQFVVRLGGNTYINTPVLIAYKGEPLFRLYREEDGYLSIDFELYDSTGEKIASVKKNNIYRHHEHRDEYAVDGTEDTTVLIDKTTGAVIADVRKRRAATTELDITVRTYLPNGQLLDLGPDTSNLGGLRMTGCTFESCAVGIEIR